MGITWSERMSVGVPALDSDHKILIGLINHLHRSIGDEEEYAAVGSVLQSLRDYASHHFSREEKMMEVCRYPLVAQHNQTHGGFAERVDALKTRYDEDQSSVRARDCLTFLNGWLINHICTTDMNYRAWVIGHPGALAAVEGLTMTSLGRKAGSVLDWSRLRVLIMDDNVNFAEILSTVLGGAGVTDLVITHDLAAAREALGFGQWDLLIADWHVGEESGLDLVKWVRRGPPDICALPILILSGHERLANRDLALLAGANDFMEKPISARTLLIGLSRLLA